MKKIYFILPSLRFGGGERVVINIANNMNFQNYEVKIISLRKGEDLESSINKNIEIVKFNKSRVVFGFVELIKFLKKDEPDVIFSGAGDINIILGFFKNITFLKKIKIIGRERGIISRIFQNNKINHKNLIIKFLYKNFLGNLNFLIVQSKIMKNEFEKYIKVSEEKIKIFYNPLDLKMIDKKSKEKIGNEFKKSRINLISVGRLDDVKNHLKMLEIFKYVDRDKYILNIVGDGKNYQKIKDKIKELKLDANINLLGFSDNPYKYMKNSDILLITSDREALPNVLLEANACGCYVLSLDCPGGIKEILENDKNGKIVNSIEEMAEELERINLNNNLREQVINYSKKYDIKIYIKKLEEIL